MGRNIKRKIPIECWLMLLTLTFLSIFVHEYTHYFQHLESPLVTPVKVVILPFLNPDFSLENGIMMTPLGVAYAKGAKSDLIEFKKTTFNREVGAYFIQFFFLFAVFNYYIKRKCFNG